MSSRDLEQALLDEIDTGHEEWITLLQSMICAASPNPPGHTNEVAAVVQKFLDNRKIAYEVLTPLKDAPNVVSTFEGAAKGERVIYDGHIDTFPASDPSGWSHGGPYSGYNDGKRIFGLGSVDMKAGTAACIVAYSLLHQHKAELKGSVGLTVVSDEETGGKWGSKYLLEHCGTPSPWKGDVVVNGEPGGLQSVRFAEKGTLRITFTVRTKGANGAYRHLSRGANIVASKLITKLLEVEDLRPEIPADIAKYLKSEDVRRVADEIMGSGASGILLVPTLNIGTFHGGAKVNTIPEVAVFEADFRLPIGMKQEVIIDFIDNEVLAKAPDGAQISYEIQPAASNPSNFLGIDHPIAKELQSAAVDVTGRRPVMLCGIGGTDCKFWRYAGVPAFTYGVSPSGTGSTDEAVSIEEFVSVIKVHTLSVARYLKK